MTKRRPPKRYTITQPRVPGPRAMLLWSEPIRKSGEGFQKCVHLKENTSKKYEFYLTQYVRRRWSAYLTDPILHHLTPSQLLPFVGTAQSTGTPFHLRHMYPQCKPSFGV